MAIPPCPTTPPDIDLAKSFVRLAGGLNKGSGVLIAKKWVLTAAHVANFAEFASHENSTSVIAKRFKLSGYDHNTHFKDLGMLKLKGELPDAEPVSSIGKISTGDPVELLGLRINSCPIVPIDTLRSCKTSVIDFPTALVSLAGIVDHDKDDCFFTNQLEGVAGGTSSGGPVFNSTQKLVGIISVGDPNGPPDETIPNRHTRIETYSTVIDDLLNGHADAWTPEGGFFFALKALFRQAFN